MKKVNFIKISLVAFIIGSIFFASCNNEDDNSNQTPKELVNNNHFLFKKLNDFNTDFKLGTTTSRSRNKIDWKHFWHVVGADIYGAGGGFVHGTVDILSGHGDINHLIHTTVYTSAIGSYNAGYIAAPDLRPVEVHYGKLNIKIPYEYTAFSNIGIDHNNVIHKYFYNKGDIKEFYQNLDLESISLLNSKDFKKTCKVIKEASIEYASNGFDYKLLSQRLLDEKLSTENIKTVTDMFISTLFECNSPEDLETLVNFYIEAIDKSGLKSLEKKALIVSFIVASESPFYLAGD
jgi:hypothetical protein